ncbi:MAG: DoxX family protein [Bacteriovoracaceae bacterium]|nr:DoxX family protein [Bacteriovoracaceae bacterium]
MKKLVLALKILPAVILLQTLFFKFTGAPESIAIFSTLGVEPWGRIATGVLELVGAILILIPITSLYGALFISSMMIGAVLSHLIFLGISVQDDGGFLFALAVIAFMTSSASAYLSFMKSTKNKRA